MHHSRPQCVKWQWLFFIAYWFFFDFLNLECQMHIVFKLIWNSMYWIGMGFHLFNSLAPGKFEWNFQTDFSDCWLRHLLWNHPDINTTGLHQRSRLRRPISKIRMILLMDAKTRMTSLIIMFAVRPICVQDSIFKMSSESPVHCWSVNIGSGNDQSTLLQVMAWCHQATSHYLNQCCPRSLSPYDITRSHRVKC